jgi:hypothetical protein
VAYGAPTAVASSTLSGQRWYQSRRCSAAENLGGQRRGQVLSRHARRGQSFERLLALGYDLFKGLARDQAAVAEDFAPVRDDVSGGLHRRG